MHILSGKASDADQLLSSWSDARRQKFADVVDKPSRMAYARVKSKLDSQDDVEALLARDPMVRALKSGMPVMPPSLRTVGEELAGGAPREGGRQAGRLIGCGFRRPVCETASDLRIRKD